MKKSVRVLITVLVILCFLAPLAFAGGAQEEPEQEMKSEQKTEKAEKKAMEPVDIAVFVPGVVAGSPLYEELVSGTERAAGEYDHVTVRVVEGGFNQAEWGEKLTSLAATGEYEYILTSNPAMPFVAMDVMAAFTDQKFINMDAYMEGNPQMYTVMYNQVEQAYFMGYIGGLVTTSNMQGANEDLKVGMIVAQEYPALLKMMRPGYRLGLEAVNPGISVDYRVIGNWYDANKAADLANSMFNAGVDVILTIAGGANQGTIKAAQDRNKYVLYFDAEEYGIAPGTIVGCAVLNQDKATYETVKKAIEGNIPWGTADVLHTRDGYVDFADDSAIYKETVPASIREKMSVVVEKMRNGELSFPVPEF